MAKITADITVENDCGGVEKYRVSSADFTCVRSIESDPDLLLTFPKFKIVECITLSGVVAKVIENK